MVTRGPQKVEILHRILTNMYCSYLSSLTDLDNGMVICLLGDDGVSSYEDTCSFTCNTGYELTGSDNRTCQNDAEISAYQCTMYYACLMLRNK